MISSKRAKGLFAMSLLAGVLAGACGELQAQTPKEHGDGGRQSTPAAQSPEANQQAEDSNEAYRHSAIVEKMGGMLGMNAEQAATTFEVINFAVLALVVGGFLVKTLPKTFRNRTSIIERQLVDARTATEEASSRLNRVEERLAKLDEQIAEIRAQSERDSVADEQRMKVSVQEEAAKILAAADQEIAAAGLQAQRQLQQYAAELAIDQAGKKLVVSAEMDRLLIQGFVRRLSENEVKGGEN